MHLETIAELESRRLTALAEQDGPAYASLCNRLGVPAEDEFLYEQGLAARAAQCQLSFSSTSPVFGVTKAGLGKFPYPALRTLFRGLHRLDIPPELLAQMNPAEILAKYFGAERVRQRNVEFCGAGFSALVRLFDTIAYKDTGFHEGALKLPTPYQTNQDDQKKRLASASDAARESFVSSFLARPHSFHDPNSDGRDKRLYVNAIYDLLRNAYEQLTNPNPASSS